MAAELTVAVIARGEPQGFLCSVASVLHQSWRGAKLLKVVDLDPAGSSARRLAHFGVDTNEVEVLRVESGGIAGARNLILRSTATRYLAWIDSGDVWHPRKLELQLSAAETAQRRPLISACRAYSRDADDIFASMADSAGVDALPDIVRAPFSTLVGDTEVFKAIGELDERLALLADEEYLLRVALAGIGAAPMPKDPALCGLAARTQSAPPQFADEANLVCTRHEAALVERFGPTAAKAYRRRLMQHRNVVMSEGPATAHGVGAPPLHGLPAIFTASGSARNRALKTRQAVRVRASALVKGIGTRVLAANALDPTHPAIVALVRFLIRSGRSSLAAVAPGLVSMAGEGETANAAPSEGRRPLTPVELSILTVVQACCAAGKLSRAEEVLEAHLAQTVGSAVHPRLIERLATVYLASGRSRSAHELLADALRTYPNEDSLHLALADTFVRTGRWAEATRQWERVSPNGKASASTGLRTRLARAYRLTGRSREALAMLSPFEADSDSELGRERDKNLRLCAGWPGCLVPIAVATREGCGRVAGRIETWGFLSGEREAMKGQLAVDANAELGISFCVNGIPIATTRALATPDSQSRVFSINCADLLYYLGDGDIIEVTTEHGRFELPEGSVAVMVHNGMPTRTQALERKLEQGHVFTKLGALTPGYSELTKREILDLYCEVADLLETRADVSVFPFYGNLLGAIRENDFIAHDADAFDMLVLCRGRSPAEVKAELAAICELLRKRSFALEALPWCVFVRPRAGSSLMLDLSFGWFTEADELNVSFGWRYAPARGRRAFTEERRCRLVDRDVRVPGNAEAVLEQLYGPTWRVPDQGFSPLVGLRRDERYLLSDAEIAALCEPAAA